MPTPTPCQMYEKYLAAEMALLQGRSYSFGDRALTRENLAEVIRGRKEWEQRCGAPHRRPPRPGLTRGN
jgi:hypothetical protein